LANDLANVGSLHRTWVHGCVTTCTAKVSRHRQCLRFWDGRPAIPV